MANTLPGTSIEIQNMTRGCSKQLFDSIFVIAQRYNRPRLVRIYEKQEAMAHE